MGSEMMDNFFFLRGLEEELPKTVKDLRFYLICKLTVSWCYGLNVCVSQNSHVEAPDPRVMTFGGGAFGW